MNPGTPKREFTEAEREQATVLAGYGLSHEMIGTILGCDDETLRKHLRPELNLGHARATAKVAQSLFNKATGGDTASMMFWMKCRAGWKETTVLQHGGVDGGPIQVVYSWSPEPLVPLAIEGAEAEPE